MLTRRRFATLLATAPALATCAKEKPATKTHIGACDWSLRERSPKAFALAAQAGLEGVQVTFDKPGGEWDLRTEKARAAYRQAEADTGVKLASLGMGILNKEPYKSVPETEAWVSDSIDVASAIGVQVVLLAFFGKGDIRGDADGTAEVVRRLKKIAPKAEDKGVVLGIESLLSGDEHLRILDAVGSPAVQVYYDVGNSQREGYDIYAEIEKIGRERICEFHAKDTADSNFGQGAVDFPRVRDQVKKIGFSGWMQIEGRLEPAQFKANGTYLKSLFA